MGSGGRTIFNFDLNEPPTDDNDERDGVFCFQPQKTQPITSSHASDLFLASTAAQGIDLSVASTAAQGIMNNHAFSHASTVSGFQPFIRSKSASVSGADAGLMIAGDQGAKAPSKSIKEEGVNVVESQKSGLANAQSTERKEEEWNHTTAGFKLRWSSICLRLRPLQLQPPNTPLRALNAAVTPSFTRLQQ